MNPRLSHRHSKSDRVPCLCQVLTRSCTVHQGLITRRRDITRQSLSPPRAIVHKTYRGQGQSEPIKSTFWIVNCVRSSLTAFVRKSCTAIPRAFRSFAHWVILADNRTTPRTSTPLTPFQESNVFFNPMGLSPPLSAFNVAGKRSVPRSRRTYW